MNRLAAVVLSSILCAFPSFTHPSFAANSVVIESITVDPSSTGVQLRIRLTNDVQLRHVTVPLVLREITAGSYISGTLAMSYGERLPAGGALSELRITNWYPVEDGACKGSQAGGFGSLMEADGSFAGPFTSPDAVMFAAVRLFGEFLQPGADVTGSMILSFDVTASSGLFEVDTTCTNPSNHLQFQRPPATWFVPTFVKGYVCIGQQCPPPPPAIAGVLDAGTGGDLVVEWLRSSASGITEYQAYCGLAPGNWTFASGLISEDGSPEYAIRIPGLTEHSEYYVAVRAFKASEGLWSEYAISGPVRPTVPVFLVHGWNTGSVETWDESGTTDDFKGWIEDAGFPLVYTPSLSSCGEPGEIDFDLNAQALADAIAGELSALQSRSPISPAIEKVDIVAHSMGGLVSRRLIATPQEFGFSTSVRRLIMLGTPNGGSNIAVALCVLPSGPLDDIGALACSGPAGCELSSLRMNKFNDEYGQRNGSIFHAVAGSACCALMQCGWLFCGPWEHSHDGIVPVSSVFSIPLDYKYTREAKHDELTTSKAEIFDELVDPILKGNAPPTELQIAATGPDSSMMQIVSSALLLADSVDWVEDTITIGPSSAVQFSLFPFGSTAEGQLRNPSGLTIDSSFAQSDTLSYAYFRQAGIVALSVINPEVGDWVVRVRARDWGDTIAPILVLAEVDADLALTFYDERPEGEVGDSIYLRARIVEGISPVLGCSVVVSAYTDSNALIGPLELLDDGVAPDEVANDGLYSGVFAQAVTSGFYNFKCEARGDSPSETDFSRFSVLQTYIVGHQRGDMDASGAIDAVDLAKLIDFVFFGAAAPYPDFIADFNCDGVSDAVDLAHLIDHVFFGGGSSGAICE